MESNKVKTVYSVDTILFGQVLQPLAGQKTFLSIHLSMVVRISKTLLYSSGVEMIPYSGLSDSPSSIINLIGFTLRFSVVPLFSSMAYFVPAATTPNE